MSMAHRAPRRGGFRKHNISSHAIDALRERMDQGEYGHRGKNDLGNLLDQAIQSTESEGHWYESIEGVPTKIWVVSVDHVFTKLNAILRPDVSGEREWACVTVLTDSMVEQNKHNGQWERRPEDLGRTPFLRVSPFENVLKDMKASNPPPVVEDLPAPEPEMVLVSWCRGRGRTPKKPEVEFVELAKAPAFIEDLVERGMISIRLWTEKPLRVRTKVVVEFD